MEAGYKDKFEVIEQSVRRESEIDRILKLNDRLKAENAELREALKLVVERLEWSKPVNETIKRARTVLAKAEKGE